jgi:hypothetical protein
MIDTELVRLAKQRVRLMTELARLFKWAGPSHPNRSKENAKRAKHRRRVRKELRENALEITSRVMELVGEKLDE